MRHAFYRTSKKQKSDQQIDLHPLTLQFSNVELEQEFVSYDSEKDFTLQKRMFIFLSIIVAIGFGYSTRIPAVQQLGRDSVILLCIHWIILQFISSETWERFRFGFHLGFRVSRLVVFMRLLPGWILPRENENFFLAIVRRSCFSILLWMGWGSKLLFYQHILLHGISTAIIGMQLSVYVCSHLLYFRPNAQNWILSIWNAFNLLSETQLDVNEQQCSGNCTAECSILLLMAYAFYVFALPTLMVWAMEIQSRYQFVEQIADKEKWGDIQLYSCWKPEIVFSSGEIHSPQPVLTTVFSHRDLGYWLHTLCFHCDLCR